MSGPTADAPAALGRVPARLLVPAMLALAVLLAPLLSLVGRTPWSTLPDRLADPTVLTALRLSLVTASVSTVLCLLLGLPLAWLLARNRFRGRSVVRALVTVPLVLPPVVAGVALLSAFGRTGYLGGPLEEWFGVTVAYTSVAVVLAQTFVALPFVVLSIEGALRAADPAYDTVAATLGAGRWTTFRRVTVPLALPGIAAGLVLGWARALGEFGATITFAGSYPGTTQTMPLAVYNALQTDPQAALVLSMLLLVVSMAVLVLLRERWFGEVVR